MEWSTYTSPTYFKLGDSWVRGDTIIAITPGEFRPETSSSLHLTNGTNLNVSVSVDAVMKAITKKKD